jgi:UDP-glucose 4-epimerase
MNILLTGGLGFIGIHTASVLVAAFESGADHAINQQIEVRRSGGLSACYATTNAVKALSCWAAGMFRRTSSQIL